MSSYEIQVSKTHPAIRAILRETVGPFSGRTILVRQVDDGWWTQQSVGDRAKVFIARLDGTGARLIPPPHRGSDGLVVWGDDSDSGGRIRLPSYDEGLAIVLLVNYVGAAAVQIVIHKLRIPDVEQIRDAFLTGKKADAKAAEVMLAPMGDYAGIASAVLQAESKMLGKVSVGKTGRQLDREIAMFLKHRGPGASHVSRKPRAPRAPRATKARKRA